MNIAQSKIDFVFRWLNLAAKHEKQDNFWWRCDGEYSPITIFINCNDLFYWAAADAEELNESNIDSYEQAIIDANKLYKYGSCYSDTLWCCRQRKMRPQGACYKNIPKELWGLIDACGPERETDMSAFGNQKPHP